MAAEPILFPENSSVDEAGGLRTMVRDRSADRKKRSEIYRDREKEISDIQRYRAKKKVA